mmetsp:Transcript_13193/g.15674  ORF Transcript_13193/g.15674 Transcript_13193/m.15674 type:complete len:144 (-) Transcript_13193:436-867(-)
MAIERNVENKKKQTHLDLCILEACEKGDKEAVRKLLNQGASCRAQRNGCRAIHVALRHGHPGCAKILISHGAIINEANRYGDTALIIASARGDVTGVKILMEAGADPSIHNKEGRTAADCSKMNWSRKTADIMSILQKTFDAA